MVAAGPMVTARATSRRIPSASVVTARPHLRRRPPSVRSSPTVAVALGRWPPLEQRERGNRDNSSPATPARHSWQETRDTTGAAAGGNRWNVGENLPTPSLPHLVIGFGWGRVAGVGREEGYGGPKLRWVELGFFHGIVVGPNWTGLVVPMMGQA
uniref:Uncharacterized protein n=1 Tax=Oryza brachyantha TaxID=4533 RepID=J3N6I0_ORYBR